MKFIVLVFSLFIQSVSFSQEIIEIFENIISGSVGNSHSEMKSLGLTLDLIQDRGELVILIYAPSLNDNQVKNGVIIIKDDFTTIQTFSIVFDNTDLTDKAMKQLQQNNYIFDKVRDNGEILYSNGIYEMGFRTESATDGKLYRVSISKKNL